MENHTLTAAYAAAARLSHAGKLEEALVLLEPYLSDLNANADANANRQGAALADGWQDAPASHSAQGRRVSIEALEDTA